MSVTASINILLELYIHYIPWSDHLFGSVTVAWRGDGDGVGVVGNGDRVLGRVGSDGEGVGVGVR